MTRAERLAAMYEQITTAASSATESRKQIAAERLLREVLTEVQMQFPCVTPIRMTEAQRDALITDILNDLGVTITPQKLALAKQRLADYYLWVDRVYPLVTVTDEY